jgi:hypothetical protein
MKWMIWSVAMLVATVLPAAVGTQSGTMAKGDKMDKDVAEDVIGVLLVMGGMSTR